MAELDFESAIAQLTNPIQDHVVEELLEWIKDKREDRRIRKNVSKWYKDRYPANHPYLNKKIPIGPLAKFGSKLIGPLQFMTPGKAMAPDLTEEERIKHPLIPFGPFERGR